MTTQNISLKDFETQNKIKKELKEEAITLNFMKDEEHI